jgi:hypothetical protein
VAFGNRRDAAVADRTRHRLTIIALFPALTWASFGKIDIVASAPGKIIPTCGL